MSKDLFVALLNKDFYKENKDLVKEEYFTGEIQDLYDILKKAYDSKEGIQITPKDIRALYDAYYHFNSDAKKRLAHDFLDKIALIEPMNPVICRMALKKAILNDRADKAASILLENNDNIDLSAVRELLNSIEEVQEGKDEDESNIVNMEVSALLERTTRNTRWKFNIPALDALAGGIGDGTFCLIAGRVNSGKSLASISFCFSPDGFCSQGAKVLYLCNEEDGAHTGLRAVSCYTGFAHAEIAFDPEKTAQKFKEIKDNVIPLDDVKMSMGKLNKMCEKYKPDIVVIDMLDHIAINGEYAREDQRLGQIYRQARELAKVHRCAVIGVSQTSAESDGKMHYGFEMLADSKTSKPAACDLILLLGAEKPDDNGNYSMMRAINVAKNKITGKHGAAMSLMKPELSRLVP